MKDFPGVPPIQPDDGAEEQGEGLTLDWGQQEWGNHRFHVHRLVEDTVTLLAKPDKAAVLGAGNHGDVDLPGLATHFQQVQVLDTENNALQEWLDSTGGTVAGRMRSLTRVDYTRLDQISFYETFEELLTGEASAGELSAFLREAAFKVRRLEALPHLKKSFSLVVSSGVHTRLFYADALTQFYPHMERYGEAEIHEIMEALVYLRNSLISDYNQLLYTLVKPDGRIVVWSDMVVLDESKRWIADELYEKRSSAERTRFLFEVFGKYGIESAVVGLKELHDRLKPDQVLFRCWVSTTDSGKTYLTAGLSGRPRE